MRRIRRGLELVFILGMIGFLGSAGWLVWESRPPEGAGSGLVIFEVAKGQSVRSVAESLKDRGLIRKALPFILLYTIYHRDENIKAGEFAVPAGRGTKETLETLLRGKIYLHQVTVAEGLTAGETFDVFLDASFGTREEFEAGFKDTADIALLDSAAADLEGYLFPETYRLPKGATAREILSSMVAQFKDVFGPEARRRASEIGMTPRQTVILASLIEKETRLPKEKPLVSAVFHNRLKIGMKLECDPTILYALRRDGTARKILRRSDLKYDSPYNTYLVKGLPPGPICNPGRASIEAALFPADADYLFFVADREGGHVFSRTLREHANAVRSYRRK